MKLLSIVACAVACAFGVGCGAHASVQMQSASADEPRLTEAERYQAAIDEAYEAYESEIAYAFSIEYGSSAEAEAVSRTLGGDRFDYLLTAALQRDGLSAYGLAEYSRMHPEFVAAQQARNHHRLWRLRAAALAIADIQPAPQMVIVVTPPADHRLASAQAR